MAWLLAHKLEMTRVVKGNDFVPVTLLEIPAIKVVSIKNEENDGYNALVLWILREWAEISLKEGKKSLSFKEFSIIKEFRVEAEDLSKYNVWDEVSADVLEWIEKVTVVAFSKWKWFSWAMKRHNFHGWPAGHGSKFHRALGSIGNRKPTRTHKGKKMHGHYGNTKVNLKKVPLEIVNKELWVIGLRGPVPGARNSLVMISF